MTARRSPLEPERTVGPGALAVVSVAATLFFVATSTVVAWPTLVSAWVGMVVLVGGLVFAWAGLRPRDVGLRAGDLGVGLAVTLLVWACIQLVGVAQGGWRVDDAWHEPGGPGRLLGRGVEQLFGNALHEEIVFRGFLLPQLFGVLTRRGGSRFASAVLALLLSQAFFASLHLPHRLAHDVVGAELLGSLTRVFVSGVVLALVYLATGNLFVAVGLHALYNHPLALAPVSRGDARAVIVVAAALAIAGCWVARRRRSRGP